MGTSVAPTIEGKYCDLIRVMVFYLFCRRIVIIIITADFCHIIYKYIHALLILYLRTIG